MPSSCLSLDANPVLYVSQAFGVFAFPFPTCSKIAPLFLGDFKLLGTFSARPRNCPETSEDDFNLGVPFDPSD